MHRRLPVIFAIIMALPSLGGTEGRYDRFVNPLKEKGMHELGAFTLLRSLILAAPHRLSGSDGYLKAADWGKATMERMGLEKVRLQSCMVPHWVRGDKEELVMMAGGASERLTICALGGSVGTPSEGVEGEVIEVKSLEEAAALGDKAKGKILFFNRPMDPTLTSTFAAYGGAVNQRGGGASAAAKVGALAAIVRSMTMRVDDVPHTGAMRYAPDAPKVPTAALSLVAANKLSDSLKSGPVRVRLTLNCETLPDNRAYNVIGEITGSEKPGEVIVMGGHLDAWDKGVGAHDDGTGIAGSLEAIRLIKELGWKPKRTIRVVLFANEENGGRGAAAYRDSVRLSREKHIAAMESDSGGFAPRGFNCSYDRAGVRRLGKWLPALKTFEIDEFTPGGGGGADVGPLREFGTVLFGLEPESQRYFDYHHSTNDQLDQVNPRELEMGALSMALLAWLISEEGV